MDALAFSLGLGLGLGIWCWQHYRLRSQLRSLLTSLPDTQDLLQSLSIVSLVRREITYLKRQSEEKENTTGMWRSLLELSPVGFLWVDANDQLLWCNQQARELLKIDRWQPGQVRLILELVRSYELDRIIHQTRKKQAIQQQEWEFYPNYSSLITADLNPTSQEPTNVDSILLKASSHPLPNGEIGIFLQNHQPLQELRQSRERAFSDLSHELRTPLTAISLVSETLLDRLQGRERKWVEQMLGETNRLMQLVQEWLDLSHYQKNIRQLVSDEEVNLLEVILSAWRSLEPLAEQKQVKLTYRKPCDGSVNGDPSRLTQVFLNLLDNSLQFSPPYQEIQLAITEEEEATKIYTCVNIVDSGPGIDEKDLPHIFRRFYRGDPARARPSAASDTLRTGSGLGLAIAREIVEAHGGAIRASNHPDTGGAWLKVLFECEPP